MQELRSSSPKKMPLGIEAENLDEYATQSKLLKEFTDIPSIGKAWTFKSSDGKLYMFYDIIDKCLFVMVMSYTVLLS